MRTIIQSLNDIDEALRGEYEERDGAYHLKLEGDAPSGYVPRSEFEEQKRSLSEFRDNNIGLKKKLDELNERVGSLIDPSDHAKLQEELEGMKKKAPEKDSQLAALTEQVETLSQRVSQADEARAEADRKLQVKGLEDSLRTVGEKAGIRSGGAMEDFIARGMRTFHPGDDGVVAKDGDKPLFSRKNPAQPLSMDEWASDLRGSAEHLFRGSSGGGADNDSAAGGFQSADGVRVIGSSDADFLANVEDIATGKAVRQESVQ